ncbi:MAG: MCP four helix bundle domain-containing protein [Thiotrichaceae bacterium]
MKTDLINNFPLSLKIMMKNLSIAKKFLILSLVAISALVMTGLYGLLNTNATFHWVGKVYDTVGKIQSINQKIAYPLNELRQTSLALVTAPNQKLRESYQLQETHLISQLEVHWGQWQEMLEGEEKQEFEKLTAAWQQYKKLLLYTTEQALAGYREAAFINVTGAEKQQFDVLFQQFSEWMKLNVTQATVCTSWQSIIFHICSGYLAGHLWYSHSRLSLAQEYLASRHYSFFKSSGSRRKYSKQG